MENHFDFFEFMESYEIPENKKTVLKKSLYVNVRLWQIKKSISIILKLSKLVEKSIHK